VSTPLAAHFRFEPKTIPNIDSKKREMEKIPYSSAVGSLMYAMICTRPDLAHSVSVVSRFMSNSGRDGPRTRVLVGAIFTMS
jgi:ATP-binding cassette subfamily B (MDR/TAP) protein 1